MKLIVSTFLVYKVKKCLQKSGKVKETTWGHDAQALGNRCPKGGDTMPKAWATLLNVVLIVVLYLDNVWIYPFLAFIYTIYGL